MNYLFVCTGNTCRSPMAEALCGHCIADPQSARSAGTFAFPGTPTAENARITLAKRGIIFSGHSSPLTPELTSWADLILCLEQHHKEAVLVKDPALAAKTMTLGEWAGEPDTEVGDPVGGALELYEVTCNEIDRLIEKGLARR